MLYFSRRQRSRICELPILKTLHCSLSWWRYFPKLLSGEFDPEACNSYSITWMVCMCLVAQSYLILWDPMDCSPPDSSVHGISQARILEWIAIFFSRGSSQPKDQVTVSCVSCIAGRFLEKGLAYCTLSEVSAKKFCFHFERMGKMPVWGCPANNLTE